MIPAIFSQYDNQWKKIPLGNSNLTIGSHGCLITCYAMVLRFFGIMVTPADVNAMILKKGGYTSGGAYYWGTLAKIYGWEERVIDVRNRPLTDAELKELETYCQTFPAIIQVDFNPDTTAQDMHFVVADGMNGTENLIADPWGGLRTSIEKKYLGKSNPNEKRAIYRIIYFRPKNAVIGSPDNALIDELKKELAEEVEKREGAEKTAKKLQAVLAQVAELTKPYQK